MKNFYVKYCDYRFPADAIQRLNLKVVETRQGVAVDGTETPEKYTKIIQQMTYQHDNPETIIREGRLFNVRCSELNGRYKSHFYQITVFINRDENTPKNKPSNQNIKMAEDTISNSKNEIHHYKVDQLSAKNVHFSELKLNQKTHFIGQNPSSMGKLQFTLRTNSEIFLFQE